MNEKHDSLYEKVDRMEEKVNQLVAAVTELIYVDKRLNSHEEQLKRHDGRIDILEQKAPIWDLATKVLWGGVTLILVAVMSGILTMVVMGNG